MGIPVASGTLIIWIKVFLGPPLLVRKAGIQCQVSGREEERQRGRGREPRLAGQAPLTPLWGRREFKCPSGEDRPIDVSASRGLAGPSYCRPHAVACPLFSDPDHWGILTGSRFLSISGEILSLAEGIARHIRDPVS